MLQWLDIKASKRHDEGQLCAGEHVTGSKSYLNMVFWNYQNMVGAKLKVGAEAYLSRFSRV